MLRITEDHLSPKAATLRLEGQVIGRLVDEVRRCSEQYLGTGHQLTLDLTEVSFADRRAIALFSRLRDRQVLLANCSPFLLEQLKSYCRLTLKEDCL